MPGRGYPTGGRKLAMRSDEVPLLLEHDQPVARLVYEPLIETPEITYGSSIGANYPQHGLTLGKHFCKSP